MYSPFTNFLQEIKHLLRLSHQALLTELHQLLLVLIPHYYHLTLFLNLYNLRIISYKPTPSSLALFIKIVTSMLALARRILGHVTFTCELLTQQFPESYVDV